MASGSVCKWARTLPPEFCGTIKGDGNVLVHSEISAMLKPFMRTSIWTGGGVELTKSEVPRNKLGWGNRLFEAIKCEVQENVLS